MLLQQFGENRNDLNGHKHWNRSSIVHKKFHGTKIMNTLGPLGALTCWHMYWRINSWQRKTTM